MYQYIRRLAIGAIAAGVFLVPALASAQGVTRAFKTDKAIQRGMIVRLTDKDNTKVEPVPYEKMDKIEGIVVAANDSPVTLSSEDSTAQQVFVATTGRYNVLVSTQNGAIKKDDYITISALAGIGMKADGKQSRIVGKALNKFDGKTNVSGQTTVRNADKKDIPIALGFVGVDINIGHNPIEQKPDTIIPGLQTLQKAAGSIVNKDVAPGQLYLGLFALIVTGIVAGCILYAGVRTSMVALGRNPLAKTSVMRNLLQVVVTSIIILIIGITAVYLILKL
jgi:hypothetical protein